jgi:NhaA family Na+:H+ antiporter
LPTGVNWRGVLLIGCLGGIGFTMSIFIATLAFADPMLLAAAKSGVLLASFAAGVLGYTLGRLFTRNQRRTAAAGGQNDAMMLGSAAERRE